MSTPNTSRNSTDDNFAPLTIDNKRASDIKKRAPPLPSLSPTDATNQQPTTQPPAGGVTRKKQRSLPVEFALGGTATSIAVLFTNPIEVVKTRFQVQGELSRAGTIQRQYNNMFDALWKIWKYEGIRGLQGGLIPAAGYQVMMNGTRLGMYAPLQRLYSRWFNTALNRRPVDEFTRQAQSGKQLSVQDAIKPNMLINVLAGTTSGVAGAFLGSPFFLMKVRLQIAQTVKKTAAATGQSHIVGTQHHYTGMVSGLSSIYNKEGIRGLFRGVQAAMLRVGMGSGVQLATYDNNKHFLIQRFGLQDGVPAHFAASMVTGMIVTCVMNPADVISTRLYNQPVTNGRGTLYSGVVDCAVKTVRSEGVTAFFKGIVPHYLRLGPHTILTFVFWEQIKKQADKFGI